MIRRIRERLPFGTSKEGREQSTESFFSFNEGGHIEIPQIGEKIIVPATMDGSLNVELEFFPTYVTLHLYFPDGSHVHPIWGRYNAFGESGDPHEKGMRHTVIVNNKHGVRIPKDAPEEKRYIGRIPQTDLYFDTTKTSGNQIVMRLYGPNKSWSLRWNDIEINEEEEPKQHTSESDPEETLQQLPLPLILR